MTQFQATARNDFLVSVPCHTAPFSDQADVALALHLIFLCLTLDSYTPLPNWMGHDATTSPRGRSGWKGTAAGRRSDMVITPAVLSPRVSSMPALRVAVLGRHCYHHISLKFASSGQSVSSERQNFCATPELNRECRRNAKGGGAILALRRQSS